jgi:hypothetical protein
MSERVKDCPMGKSEKKNWKHLSLSEAQKVELLQLLEDGVCARLRTEEYVVATAIVSNLKKHKLIAKMGGGFHTVVLVE